MTDNFKNALKNFKNTSKNIKKEIRGVYNVSFNDKKSTPINTELEIIENAIIDYVIYYVKGWHNIKKDKGIGSKHIKIHLTKGSEGEIKLEELLNLGNFIREYLKIFKEPFIDIEGNKSAKLFEWQNKEGIRFRVVTDKIKGEGLPKTPLSPSDEIIITFYSDRNLNKQMEFKNPKVKEYYENKKQENNLNKRVLKK